MGHLVQWGMNFKEASDLAKEINDEESLELAPVPAAVVCKKGDKDGYGIQFIFWSRKQYEDYHARLHIYC